MIYSPTNKDYCISQGFGANPKMYKKYGLKGHNGQDLSVPIGTPIYAPIAGVVLIGNEGLNGFGKYVRVTELVEGERKEITLAHLSRILVKSGQIISEKILIGYSGNTGNSTGPHLHWQLRRLDKNNIVKNYNNGFKGSENIFSKSWILKHNNLISRY